MKEPEKIPETIPVMFPEGAPRRILEESFKIIV